MYVCMYVYIYIYIYYFMCIYIYIYIYIHTGNTAKPQLSQCNEFQLTNYNNFEEAKDPEEEDDAKLFCDFPEFLRPSGQSI